MSVTKLCRITGRKITKGEVGIEIEVEGSNLPPEIAGWRRDNDGSLRGESAEYVLERPIPRESIPEYLQRVTKAYEQYSSEINDTDRAGVHIHVNVQDMQVHQVITYICLYLLFEDMLVRFCGESRVGNLFCLRMRDAEGVLRYLEECIENRDVRLLATDNLRYASVNVLAMHNYGSVEFRAMRTTTDMNLIRDWANMLLNLKDLSREFEHPRDLVEKYSALGPQGLFDKALLVYKQKLTYPDWDKDMWENARVIQDLAYCTDWDEWIKWEHDIDNPVNPFKESSTPYVEMIRPRATTARTRTVPVATPPPPPPIRVDDVSIEIRRTMDALFDGVNLNPQGDIITFNTQAPNPEDIDL